MPKAKAQYQYTTADEVYGSKGGRTEGVSLEDAYGDLTPWDIQLSSVAEQAQKRATDPEAISAYQMKRFTEAGRAYGQQFSGRIASDLESEDAGRRQRAEQTATTMYMKSIPGSQLVRTSAELENEYQQSGAFNEALADFLRTRHLAAYGFAQTYRQRNPKASEEEVRSATQAEMQKYGYEPAGETDIPLPDLPVAATAPPDYIPGISEVSSIGQGVLRGTYRLAESGAVLGTAAGEAVTAESQPEQGYLGERVGASVSGEENIYAQQRQWMDALRKRVMENPVMKSDPVPYMGGFDLAGAVGEAIPQLYLMASGAAQAHGAQLAGNTGRALVARSATMGTMYALEGSGAFQEYMQYAEKMGLDPADAARTALGGALVYAAASSALEYHGPFNALEKTLPGVKRRIVAMSLIGATEAGTEALQSLTQSALAVGLDLRDLNWETLSSAIRQAGMEGLVGGIVGGGAGGVAFQGGPGGPVMIGPDGNPVVTDPTLAAQMAAQIAQETDRLEHQAPRVIPFPGTEETAAGAEIARQDRVLQFPTELVAPPADAGPAKTIQFPTQETGVPGETTVIQFPQPTQVPEAQVVPEGATVETVADQDILQSPVFPSPEHANAWASEQGWQNHPDYEVRTNSETGQAVARIPYTQTFDYRASDRITQTQRAEMRQTMQQRVYPPNSVLHTTTLEALGGIAQTGIQPSETIDGEMAVSGSWTDPQGRVTGATLSYGRRGVPVVVVMSGDVEARGQVGDTVVKSPGKSYVDPSDIIGVYVGEDPRLYTLEEARALYGDQAEPRPPAMTIPAEGPVEPGTVIPFPPLTQQEWIEQHEPGESPAETRQRLQDENMRAQGAMATSLQRTTVLSPRAQEAVEAVGPIAADAPGSAVTTPHATYEAGSKNLERDNKNVWVRQTTDTTNEDRVLLVQWSSDLLQTGERGESDAYYDALYEERSEDGYVRADDFWELPQWIGQAAYNLPNTDVYVVRDLDEAIKFLNAAKYKSVAMSVLDVNKNLARSLAEGYSGQIDVGGYTDLATIFQGLEHVKAWDTMAAWVESQTLTFKGIESHPIKFKVGTNYRHFAGTKIIPRLTMSEGCLHHCAFCAVTKKLCVLSLPDIQQQVDSFVDLEVELVYLNDKTFGQAENYAALEDIYRTIKERNPQFQGFIIQTTAAQMKKLDIDFLKRAGVKFVELGVESYNTDILKKHHKPANEAVIDAAVDKLREAQISLIPNVLIGLPEETAETYARTLAFLRENLDIISHVNAYNLAVYAGTELADVVESVSDLDVDENRVEKSFHQNPEVHTAFADSLFALGQELLNNPAVGVQSERVINYEEAVQAVQDTPVPVTIADFAAEYGIPDGSPEEGPFLSLAQFLSDESGAIAIDRLAFPITGTAEEVRTLAGGVQALVLDESAPLRRTIQGLEAVSLIDEAEARHRRRRAPLIRAYDQVLADMSHEERRAIHQWAYTLREDGQTNWATLIEHPERLKDIPPGVEAVRDAYVQGALVELGDAAEAANIPQLRAVYDEDGKFDSWQLLPFQRAQTDKYLRFYTQDGMDLFAFQDSHPLWQSFLEWGQRYPERNPDLDFADPEHLRKQLEGARQTGTTRKAGSLEFVRIFKELPVALQDANGNWVNIQLRDPREHFLAAVENQSRRIAFWTTATDMLLPRYGTYDEETDRVTFQKLGSHPDLVDVDGLIDRLRKDVVSSMPQETAQAESIFNRLMDNYQRTHFGGYMEEYLVTLGSSKLAKLATAVDRSVTANVLMLAPLWDAFNPIRGAAVVGWQNMLEGYASALADMAANPQQFAAEYQAMGAVIDGHTEWAVHKDEWFSDIFIRNIPQALTTIGRWTEIRSQFIISRMYDLWVQKLASRKHLSRHDARLLKRHLRLTDEQVAEISRGELSEPTRAKIVQNAVNTIAGLTEARHRKGAIQNHPLGRFAFRFLSVVNAVTRAGVRHVGDLALDIREATDPTLSAIERQDAARAAIRSGWSLLSFVAAIAGSGFLQRYLRRAATGRPLLDPEDPESWAGLLAESLAEGGIFGPFYRIMEAGKYSNGNLYELPSRLIFPLAVAAEVGSALLGVGRYDGSPWSRRLSDLGVQFTPLWKAARNWVAKVQHPSRETYYTVKKQVRKFNESRGITPRYADGAQNPYYRTIFEAVRDGNEAALDDAIATYATWAKEQGLDEDTTRTRLRSSLMARRPINLNEDAAKQFLESLSDEDKKTALAENERYTLLMNRLTRKPGKGSVDWYESE